MVNHKDLAHKIEALELKYKSHNQELKLVFRAIGGLLAPPPLPPRRRIGYKTE